MEFYSHFLLELKDSTAMVLFCKWVNDLFDALKSPDNCVKKDDNYEVIF